jgi:hypothetical protein
MQLVYYIHCCFFSFYIYVLLSRKIMPGKDYGKVSKTLELPC